MFQEALRTGADGVYSKTLPMAQLLMMCKGFDPLFKVEKTGVPIN